MSFSDLKFAILDYQGIVQIQGRLQNDAIHMAVCLVDAAEGGIGTEGYVYGAVYLLILQNDAVQDSCLIGADTQLRYGAVVLARRTSNISLFSPVMD